MADSVLSRIQILLDANTARFEQSLRDAQDTARSTFSTIATHAKTMAVGIATASTGAIVSLIHMADEYSKQAVELEQYAYLAQSSVADFQKMSIGAQAVGLSTEQLADQMKDFREKTSEFMTAGSGGFVDFMEQVAVKTEGSADGAMKLAKQIANLSGPEAMQLYVKKMQEANLSQGQMSFLMESMASDSTKLLPILVNNAEGMNLWAKAAEDAGIILDDKTITAAHQLQVQSQMLDMQLQGLKNNLMQAVIPAFVDIAGAFSVGDGKARGLASGSEVLANALRGVAVIAVGIYGTLNLVANAIAGVTKSAVDSYAAVNAQAEKSRNFLDKLPGVKLGKFLINIGVDAQSPTSGIQQAAQDNAAVLEDTANTINKIWNGSTSNAVKRLAEIQGQSTKTNAVMLKGAQDWLDKQNKAASATKKHNSELDRQIKLIAQYAKEIKSSYSSEAERIGTKYAEERTKILKAFKGDEQQKYLKLSAERFHAESELYVKELNFQYAEYSLTEEQKLAKQLEIDKLKVAASKEFNPDQRQLIWQSLEERYAYEQQQLELTQAKRLSDAQSIYSTDMQNLMAKYAYERRQLELNKQLAEPQKTAELAALNHAEDRELSSSRSQVWSSYQNAVGIDTSADDAKSQRDQAIQDALDWELITREEYQQRMLQSEQQFHADRASLALSSGEAMFGSMVDMLKSAGDEQSALYKTMFVAQKAFAIASSMVAIQTGIAEASANPFPYNLAAMASVAAATASIISNISSVAGVFHGGTDYVPKESSYLLDKGERVLSPRQNQDLTSYLSGKRDSSAQGGSGANITINNNSTAQVNAQQNSDGSITIDMVEQHIVSSLRNPNSRISKSVGTNTTASRRR